MKKQMVCGFSFLLVFLLTAQTCSFGSTSTGLAAECVGEGTVVCEDTEAYQCQLASYGLGYYVTRASGYDIEYCGAQDTTTDTDGDGLTDYDEINTYYTDPEDRDSDDDGALDGEEVVDETDPMDATSGEVTSTSTFPTRTMSSSDSDGDGLTDIEEITAGTDPDDVDSDDDYLSDYDEVNTYSTNPNLADTDSDGYNDGLEVRAGSDPLDAGSVPAARDRDSDGMPDFFEIAFGLDPLDASDAATDLEGDGLTNYDEYIYGTKPTSADTDGDGYIDYDEINTYGTDPLDVRDHPLFRGVDTFPMMMGRDSGTMVDTTTDTDGDGLTDYEESNLGTDETVEDTDGDGYSDYVEAITYETDPLDDADTPLDADCGMSETEIYVGIEKTFDGSASAGELDFYGWDWGDGTSDVSIPDVEVVSSITHEYTSAGVYLPALTITDVYGNTATCNIIATVQNTDEKIEDVQIFKLEDMTHYTTSGSSDDNFPITAITEESWRERDSRTVKNTKLVDSAIVGKDAGYYLDFYSSDSDPRYVIFADAEYLQPTDWIIVQVEGYMATAYRTRHQYLLAKMTDECGEPLYSILTHDEKYKFSIMIEGTEHTLASDSEVTNAWQEVRGVYTGDEILLYVDRVLEDSETVSGEISSSAAASSLVLGYNTACSDYQYYGYIDDIFIYGE